MSKNLHTNTIYLIGIGGIGMSALARYFKQQGKEVSGYDRISTPLTKSLETEGMNIHYIDDPAYVPCDAGMVIYTPAIPNSNRELNFSRKVKLNIYKRAEVLGMIAEDYQTIAVAGTHGKTTISSMISHVMHSKGYPVTAFIGGIMNNYNTNMICDEKSTYLVAEADEYDRSFLKLHPHIAVISALAADHLDIFGTMENMIRSFSEFVSQVDPEGAVIVHESVAKKISVPVNSLTYGTGPSADLRVENIRIENHQYHFELHTHNEIIDIGMKVPGLHNIENATAAAGVCLQAGISVKEIKEGLESYKGVKRRFEFVVSEGEKVFIDDYAHHPEELAACITTAKSLYPAKKITGIFQPHLYSRTRDFATEFAASLEELDDIILLDIYPAREEPIEGIDSEILLNKINNEHKIICSKENLMQIIKDKNPDILITMGAGDIDQLIEPIKEIMIAKA